MALKEDLQKSVSDIFRTQWTERDGTVVPEPKDLGLGNDGVNFKKATVLYADLDGSTQLVDSFSKKFAAEVYKTYLLCAAKIIKDEGGSITAYDGDRVMAVFIGNAPNNDAVRCALKINWAVRNIVNAELKAVYPKVDYTVNHVVGIDTSSLMAARIGVRNDNDLVWVGRAANYAAKLTSLSSSTPTWITGDVYDALNDEQKYGGQERKHMWTELKWVPMNCRSSDLI